MSRQSLARPVIPDWDSLVTRFCHADFIPTDPISFPHRYVSHTDWRHSEFAAFVAALMSYGRRDKILESVERILAPLGPEPLDMLASLSSRKLKTLHKGFYYRFNTHADLVLLLTRLNEIYAQYGSLKQFWESVASPQDDLRNNIAHFRNAFLSDTPLTYGLKFWFADPSQNSAAKRFNMFLRWMVRQDAVDLGYWADVLSPSQLVFPLDTHVASMARRYHITHRQTNTWQTAQEITDYFKQFCAEDPVKYDFALFGLGVFGGV